MPSHRKKDFLSDTIILKLCYDINTRLTRESEEAKKEKADDEKYWSKPVYDFFCKRK